MIEILENILQWVTADWIRSLSIFGNVVLGIIAFLRWREASRLRRIEERREAREEEVRRSADLRAHFRPTSRSPRLRIVNEGEATARNVHVLVDGLPILEQNGFDGNEEHPIPALGPGENGYEYLYSSDRDNPNSFRIRLQWEDESGSGEWESTVNVRTR